MTPRTSRRSASPRRKWTRVSGSTSTSVSSSWSWTCSWCNCKASARRRLVRRWKPLTNGCTYVLPIRTLRNVQPLTTWSIPLTTPRLWFITARTSTAEYPFPQPAPNICSRLCVDCTGYSLTRISITRKYSWSSKTKCICAVASRSSLEGSKWCLMTYSSSLKRPFKYDFY